MAESAGPGRRLRAWAGSGLSPGVGPCIPQRVCTPSVPPVPVALLHLLPSSFPSVRRAPGGAARLSCSSCFCGLMWDPTHPCLPPAALISANLLCEKPSSCETFLAQGSSTGCELQCQCHQGHAAQCGDNQGCLHTRLAPGQGRTIGAGERQRPLLPPLRSPRHLTADESAMGAAPGPCRVGAIGLPA